MMRYLVLIWTQNVFQPLKKRIYKALQFLLEDMYKKLQKGIAYEQGPQGLAYFDLKVYQVSLQKLSDAMIDLSIN